MIGSLENYKNAFMVALVMHIVLALGLLMDVSHQRPVLTPVAKSEANIEEQAIKAVAVDSAEVMKTVNQLKEERLHQKQLELRRQQQLEEQARLAQKQRQQEQQRLEKIKKETQQLAIAREKALVEEQEHLKQLAKAREQEALHLEQLKKQQQAETLKLAELKKTKEAELARAEALKQAQLKEAQLKQQKLAEEKAADDAAKQARLAGEVDKYKALIINAISRQWILPENADSSKSSQFRIRLAPNGVVLDVNLMRSSGDPILDRSAQSAIYKASPLPVPNDPDTFNLFRDISLTVRPENVRG
jgi:colicin import membrane protein